jgi:hypothetical protein
LHNSLKEGLQKLGNDVTILGFKDGFKDFSVDFTLEKKWDSGFRKKIKLALFILTGFDISSYLTYRQFWKKRNKFKDYDVVQLINENSFFCDYTYEKKILKYLFKHNKKVFLLSAGDDYMYVNYNFEHPENPSVVQPYLAGKIEDINFSNVLKFRTKSFQKLHEYIYENIQGVITSDLDYHIPLKYHSKYLKLIPNPIIVDDFTDVSEKVIDKIIIFHGINRESYYRKGNDYFEIALVNIKEKYNKKVEIISTENIPYKDYILSYNKAHIVLDQVFACDQGYNALEAMAKGKVVFTGAEKVFENYYNLTKKVAINALPDILYLEKELTFLIDNPHEIEIIGKNAKAFIEKEHNYLKIAQKYITTWTK